MATNLKKPTNFFKIISDYSLHEGKLMIPRAFVEKYGEVLPEAIFLKPPNGAGWKLNLVKHDGKIWFQEGWKEFAEHYSLAHGHLLLFHFGGTSHFQLRIFGMNGLEISYPLKTEQGKRASSNGEGKKPAANDENSKDYQAGRKRKANLSLEFLQPCKMGSGGGCVKAGNAFKSQKAAASSHTDQMCKGKQVTTAQQLSALDRASSFKTRNPSFLVFMHPSFIHSGQLNLPHKFCLRQLDMSKQKRFINLQVFNGRVWTANFLIKKSYATEKIALGSGWRAFVKDNNLKVGDVCIFELIVRTNQTFQVHIFRDSSDNSNCSTSQGKQVTTGRKVTAFDRARSFKACNPSFQVFIYPPDIRSQMSLPPEFCLRHLDLSKPQGVMNLRVLNGRVWTTKYLVIESDSRRRIVLGSGWGKFIKDNNLKVGDVCTFELIVRTNQTFQVHIFRDSSDNSNCSTSQVSDFRAGQKRKANLLSESLQSCKMGRSRCVQVRSALKLQNGTDNKCKGKQVITAKQVTALDRASSFKTCNPSFLVFMHPSSVCRHLNLPPQFLRRHLDLSKPQGVFDLRVLNGRVWTAAYLIWKNNSRTRIVLRRGWREFVKDNNLKVGDVCIFELIVKTNNTFKVHIFRQSDNASCSTSQGKQVIAQQVTALDRASSLETCNPSFQIFMHLSYINGRMNLPPMFYRTHLDLSKRQGAFNLRVSNERVWTAMYRIMKIAGRTKIELSSGWKAFVKDNNLKVGDVCIFELIDKTNKTFQVHIFREQDI